MITIPIQKDSESYDLYIVMGDTSMDRIRNYDPVELVIKKMGPPFDKLKLRVIFLCYASVQELHGLASVSSMDDLKEKLLPLNRGWQYRPDLGDEDTDQYTNLADNH